MAAFAPAPAPSPAYMEAEAEEGGAASDIEDTNGSRRKVRVPQRRSNASACCAGG
jgi:hypothetical protein